jgi:isocitrate lyase
VPEPEDDIEARVRRPEDEVGRLKDGVIVSRADAAAARVLAGGADRDVSDVRTELRAYRQALNALRETQLEQGQQIAELRAELRSDVGGLRSEMHAEIGSLRSEMQRGFGMVHTGMAQIVALLRDAPDPGTS